MSPWSVASDNGDANLEFASRRIRRPAHESTKRGEDHGRARLLGSRLLAVGDEESPVRPLAAALADEGCDVRLARTAEDALIALQAFSVRIVILDLVLPRMSGLILTERIKATAATRDIIVIAVSSIDRPEVERLAKEAGCSLYVSRPIDEYHFIRALARFLSLEAEEP
jgi:two-component system, cell cycle response regulator DivK